MIILQGKGAVRVKVFVFLTEIVWISFDNFERQGYNGGVFFKLEDLYQKPRFGPTESLLVQGLKIVKLIQGYNNARFAEVLLVQGGMNYVLVL